MRHVEQDIAAAETELDDDTESIITNERYVEILPAWEKTMKEKQKLTAANIRYLLTMKSFADSNKPIRNSYLADCLQIKKSSVHSMLKYLDSIGMITKDQENIIYLTEKGTETALRYQQYYTKPATMMNKCFPDLDESENAILALLSEIPEHTLQHMLHQK